MLEVMKTSTNILSYGSQATASLILPTKHTILKEMANLTDSSLSALVKEAKCTIFNDLESR